LFINIPFNSKDLSLKTFYEAFYNKLFINGQRSIGTNRTLELFDRNRTYFGAGYVLNSKIKLQVGFY